MPLPTEDALTYLPRKPLQEFVKGAEIYNSRQANGHLYVVIKGLVKISTTNDDGCQTIARIVAAEGLFGESCLVGSIARNEWAAALDMVAVMSWTSAEVLQQVEREPRLGVALAQYLVRQCMEMQDRIESMATYKTPERIMLALLQLGADVGVSRPDRTIRLSSLTHHTIADFVGTSREIVTFQMNRLRRMDLIRYSRRHLDVCVEAMEKHLREKGVRVPEQQPNPAHRAAG